MPHIIAIANQKGGVGKTTSTVNLGYLLRRAGKRVLVVDTDPQSSLTVYYGADPRALETKALTLYHSLLKDRPLGDLIVPGDDGRPDLVPSSIRLASAEAELVSLWDSASALREKLRRVAEGYDVVLIDCPPTLSLLTVNALAAADSVLIPVKTDYLSMMGIPLFLETIEKVRTKANPALRVLGVLPTMYNPRNSHDQEALQELRRWLAADTLVFEPVNRSTAYDKAAAENRPTVEILPDAPGVSQYQAVATYIIDHA